MWKAKFFCLSFLDFGATAMDLLIILFSFTSSEITSTSKGVAGMILILRFCVFLLNLSTTKRETATAHWCYLFNVASCFEYLELDDRMHFEHFWLIHFQTCWFACGPSALIQWISIGVQGWEPFNLISAIYLTLIFLSVPAGLFSEHKELIIRIIYCNFPDETLPTSFHPDRAMIDLAEAQKQKAAMPPSLQDLLADMKPGRGQVRCGKRWIDAAIFPENGTFSATIFSSELASKLDVEGKKMIDVPIHDISYKAIPPEYQEFLKDDYVEIVGHPGCLFGIIQSEKTLGGYQTQVCNTSKRIHIQCKDLLHVDPIKVTKWIEDQKWDLSGVLLRVGTLDGTPDDVPLGGESLSTY